MALLLWVVVIDSLLLFLAAAKTHGRQLRLERELRGYMEVQFGTGTNPAWVESLWRRDRIRFWTMVPLAGLAFVALALAPFVPAAALPLSNTTDDPRLALALIGAILWAPTLAFLTLATLSLRRFRTHRRAAAQPDAQTEIAAHPPRWHTQAKRGTLFWFTTCLLLFALVLAFSMI